MFLPICSTISTSISLNCSRAINSFALACSTGSRSHSSSAGTASMIAVSSAAFSTIAMPKRKFFFDMMKRAVLGSSSPKLSKP